LKHVVVVVQVNGLLDGLGVDARQAPDGRGEVPVGAGIVDGPVGAAHAPVEVRPELPVDLHAEEGYMRRAKVHSPGQCQSPGTG